MRVSSIREARKRRDRAEAALPAALRDVSGEAETFPATDDHPLGGGRQRVGGDGGSQARRSGTTPRVM